MEPRHTTRRHLLAAAGAVALAAPCAAAMPGSRPPAAIPPDPDAPARPRLFRSFFLGGFECSSHRRADGHRLDLIAGTRHDALALSDYEQLSQHGIGAARDGIR